MLKHRIRTILSLLLLCLALLMAATAMWLNRHPETLLGMLNRQLPAGMVVHEVRGLRVSAFGGELALLSAEQDGHALKLGATRWRWSIEHWWPLTLAPQSIETGQLELRLAATDPANASLTPLPRFWNSEWWPRIAGMHAQASHFSIADADGAPLIEGSIDFEHGAASGNALLRAPGSPAVSLQWEADTGSAQQPAWQLTWQSGAPLAASGTLTILANDSGADWRFTLQAAEITLRDQQLRELEIRAAGSSDLFAARTALAQATLQASGKLATADGAASWHCEARLEVLSTGVSSATVDSCTASSGNTGLILGAPLTLLLDADFNPQTLRFGSGALHIEDAAWQEWHLDTLHADIAAAAVWAGGDTPLLAPPLRFSAQLANSTLATTIDAEGAIDNASWQNGRWEGALNAVLHANYRKHEVAPLALLLNASGNSAALTARGQLDTKAIGRLLDFSVTHDNTKSTTRARATLDTDPWKWGEGLLGTLLGPRQTLFGGDLQAARVRATLRLDQAPGHLRMRADGEATRMFAMVSGIGIAGLDITPFSVDYRDGAMAAFAPLEARIDSVNAGITLNRLHGRLEHAPDGWRLNQVGGEVLGGSFELSDTGPLDADPLAATLTLKAIDMERIARLLDNPDLSFSGSVGGSLPLKLSAGKLTVEAGRVASEHGGVIRYRPAAGSAAEPAELVTARKALSNLQFDAIEATLDYAADGKLSLQTALRGRNPELDATRPVHLNLTVETNLRTLLQGLRAGNRVTEWLDKRVADPKR
ncbi:MAG: YdbH domain-containing protein [Gammaproteobacteria bacterium]|nr:YdbH domain-containing protein [Gammaproteobacteria bacterium]